MFSNDIDMEFGMKKCGPWTLERGEIVESRKKKFEWGNKRGWRIRIHLGIVQLDTIREVEMKGKIGKECKRKLWLVLKSRLNGRNKMSSVNT